MKSVEVCNELINFNRFVSLREGLVRLVQSPKDWELRKIAETGGVVGIIFMNYWLMPHETRCGLNYIARTLEHFVNVAGVEHVAIGTDFDGFTDPPDDLHDASQLPRLTQRPAAEGYGHDAILKILGGNVLRVLREGWGKKG